MSGEYPLIGLNYIDYKSESVKDWSYPVGVSLIADVLYTILSEAVKSMLPGPDDTTKWSQDVFNEYIDVALEQYTHLSQDILKFKEQIDKTGFKYIFDYTIKLVGDSKKESDLLFIPLKDVDQYILNDIISVKIEKVDGRNLFIIADRLNKSSLKLRFAYLDEKRNAYIVFHKVRPLFTMLTTHDRYIHMPIFLSKKDYDNHNSGWYSNPLIRAEIVESRVTTDQNQNQIVKKIVVDTISTLNYKDAHVFISDLHASNEFEEAIISVYKRVPPKNTAYVENVVYRKMTFYYHSSITTNGN